MWYRSNACVCACARNTHTHEYTNGTFFSVCHAMPRILEMHHQQQKQWQNHPFMIEARILIACLCQIKSLLMKINSEEWDEKLTKSRSFVAYFVFLVLHSFSLSLTEKTAEKISLQNCLWVSTKVETNPLKKRQRRKETSRTRKTIISK